MSKSIQGNGPITNVLEQESPCREDLLLLEGQLEAVTKEMNQFTYVVSHDLQAPLRMVTGFLELLRKKYSEDLDEQAKQYISYAVKGAEKMKRLVFDLLEYSRLTTTDEQYESVDLNNLILEVTGKFVPLVNERGGTITVTGLPVLRARKKQLARLFEQLIDNAIKFRIDPGPVIDISAEREGRYWKIRIKDNGIGIDPVFFEKIFVVFRRLHPDEEKFRGTGIGLAICRKICELHGGGIGVNSGPGTGSTFWVTLPAA